MKIIVDKGILPLSAKALNTNYSYWGASIFFKYFGSTLRYYFDNYRKLSFGFKNMNSPAIKYTRNGFNDFADFVDFVNNKFGDGTSYTTNVELEIYMDIDTKIPEPTIYAKNSMMGALSGRNGYRTSKFVFDKEGGAINNNVFITVLRNIWLECFGEDLTEAFIQNHRADFAKMFWVKKDNDRLGIIQVGLELSPSGSSQRYLYNSTKSDPATDTLVIGTTTEANNASPQAKMYAGTYAPPKVFVYETGNYSNVLLVADFNGRRIPYRSLAGSQGYSTIVAMPVEVHFDNGNGTVDTYRAIHLSPVGVDTVYIDFVDNTEISLFSVRKYPNGNMRIKEIPFTTNGDGQRLGRLSNSKWLDFDVNDTKSEGTDKGMGEVYFAYREIGSGKFSRLSSSKLTMFKDNRFHLPVFTLNS